MSSTAAAAQGFAGAINEQGAQAFAASQNRIALRRVQTLWTHIGRRQCRVKHALHA
jgi:hypothetical protein